MKINHSFELFFRSRLAIPSLGGIFEEHSGIAIKGAIYPSSSKHQDPQRPFSDLDEMDFDLDSEFCDDAKVSSNFDEGAQEIFPKNRYAQVNYPIVYHLIIIIFKISGEFIAPTKTQSLLKATRVPSFHLGFRVPLTVQHFQGVQVSRL